MNHTKYIIIICLVLTGYIYADSGNTIDFSDRTDITLENGLRVILIEHHEQPTISYRLLVNAGVIDDPLEKRGLAMITAHLLKTGTTSRKPDEIIDTTALISSNIAISTSARHTSISIDVLKRYSNIGFEVFSDVILNPVFPSQELKQIINEHVNYTKMALTNNSSIATDHANFLLFGSKHPVGIPKTEKSLKAINRKEVKAFYQKFFHPNNSILIAVGDFSRKDMLSKIKNKFGRWQKNDLADRLQTKMDPSRDGTFRVVDKAKLTQAVIYLNQWSAKSTDKDYFAYQLMNYILGGGGFSSRLMEAVRAKGGKTYGIGSRYSSNLDYGVLSISTSTRNEQLLNTFILIQSEFNKLIDEGITTQELSKAKAYKTGSIPLQMESPGMIANKLLSAIAKGFTIEDISKEIDQYKQVTRKDINRVIKTHLDLAKMNIVIVADEKEIKEQLNEIGDYQKVHYKTPIVKEPLFNFFGF